MFMKMFSVSAVLIFGALTMVGLHHPGANCPGARLFGLANVSAAYDEPKDKDKAALTGAWVQTGAEMKIVFADKDVLKIYPHGDKEVIVVVCSYTAEKDALVKAKITELKAEGEAKDKVEKILPIGLEFSFKWTVKDDAATLDEVKGEKVDALKSHLEGKYGKK